MLTPRFSFPSLFVSSLLILFVSFFFSPLRFLFSLCSLPTLLSHALSLTATHTLPSPIGLFCICFSLLSCALFTLLPPKHALKPRKIWNPKMERNSLAAGVQSEDATQFSPVTRVGAVCHKSEAQPCVCSGKQCCLSQPSSLSVSACSFYPFFALSPVCALSLSLSLSLSVCSRCILLFALR